MTKVLLKPEQYILEQIALALGPTNRYYTGLEVRRDPDPDQCLTHWEKDGGAAWFREHFGIMEEMPSTAR